MEIIFKQYIKPYIKPFLILFAVYSVAMLSIWRAGVSFADDITRAVTGNAWGSRDFNRYSMSWIHYILNVDVFRLTDISPLPQIVAMAINSISCVIVTYLFCDRKIRYVPLILSAFIGLSPFIMENWLYKFESLGFGLCFLASIAPMLFWDYLQEKTGKKPLITFLIVSTACLFVMWTSYQSGNGIYLVMVLGLAFRDFLEKRKLSEILKTIGLFAIPYIMAAFIFRFVLPAPVGYRETEMLAMSDMLPGIWRNIVGYLKFLSASLRSEWIVLISLMLISFAVSLFAASKREGYKRLIDVLVGVAFVIVCVPVSYGALLLLQSPAVNARSSLGIGVILAIVGIVTCRGIKGYDGVRSLARYLLPLSAVVLLYSFAVFSLALGNALSDQHRWETFRTEALLEDLSRLYPYYNSTDSVELQLTGDVGLSAVAAHVDREYPITDRILANLGHANYELRRYYGWNIDYAWINLSDEWQSWEIKLDTYYHTIRESGDGVIHVEMK